MKTKLIALVLSVLATFHAAAVPVKINIQGSNIVVRWPSQNSQQFIIGYRAALDAAHPWTILRTNYPASTSNETVFIMTNVVPLQNFGGGGGGGAGGPPGFNAASSSSSGSTITSSASIAERAAIAEERRAQALKIIMPPPVQATKRQDFRVRTATAESAVALAEGQASAQSASELAGNVVSSGFFMVSEYYEDVDGDTLPSATELAMNLNPFIKDTNGNGIDDGYENFDGDPFDNGTEIIIGSDPLLSDANPLPPLTVGGVYSGQYDITFPIDANYTNILGPMLFCNNGVTADSLVTTQPSAGHLRLNWHSVFVQSEGNFFTGGGGANASGDSITLAERNALADAFGQGTDMDLGRLSKPNQLKVSQLSENALDYYQRVASEQLRREFQLIQELNTGLRQPPPGMTAERFMKIRLNQIHTQFTRLQSVNTSLFKRFGRALNRFLPFLGGILIIANADAIAQEFLSSMQDYARDIFFGDDETGDAAILAGRCNDLAAGSGNLVLSYLLR